MTVLTVTQCCDCPFALIHVKHAEDRACMVYEDAARELVDGGKFVDPDMDPPPSWCPLRHADRLVRLEAK